MKNASFTDLELYKACRQLRKDISQLTISNFPIDEKYRLSDQVIRSSRSVTANIAEGHGRYYFKENIAFCRKSRGSLSETLEHIITAFDQNYITSEKLKALKLQIDSCMKLLNGYIKYLNRVKPQKDENDLPTSHRQ
ncbi:MAG: four helix bundle protein [Saprospiraceae bacterium]